MHDTRLTCPKLDRRAGRTEVYCYCANSSQYISWRSKWKSLTREGKSDPVKKASLPCDMYNWTFYWSPIFWSSNTVSISWFQLNKYNLSEKKHSFNFYIFYGDTCSVYARYMPNSTLINKTLNMLNEYGYLPSNGFRWQWNAEWIVLY